VTLVCEPKNASLRAASVCFESPKHQPKKNLKFLRSTKRKVETFQNLNIKIKFQPYDRASMHIALGLSHWQATILIHLEPHFFLVKMFVHDEAFEGIPRENKYFGKLMEGSCGRHHLIERANSV